MSKRDERIAMYVTSEQKEWLQQRANDEEVTLSGYCHDILSRHIEGGVFDEKDEELKVERRLEELVGLARDEIEDAAEDIRQTQQKTALHTIALWELLKTDAGAAHRKEAMTEATRRLHENLVKSGIDPDALGERTTQQAESTQAEESEDSEQADPATETTESADGDWKTWKNDDDADAQTDGSASADSSAADAGGEADDEPWWKPNDDQEDGDGDEDDDVYIDRDWDI